MIVGAFYIIQSVLQELRREQKDSALRATSQSCAHDPCMHEKSLVRPRDHPITYNISFPPKPMKYIFCYCLVGLLCSRDCSHVFSDCTYITIVAKLTALTRVRTRIKGLPRFSNSKVTSTFKTQLLRSLIKRNLWIKLIFTCLKKTRLITNSLHTKKPQF